MLMRRNGMRGTSPSIVTDLEQAGYLSRKRNGQRTQYTVNHEMPLRHPAETGLSVRDLLDVLPGLTPHEEADTRASSRVQRCL